MHQVSGRQEHVTVLYTADGVRYQRPDATFLLRYADRVVAIIDAKTNRCRETSLDDFLVAQKQKEHQPDLPSLGDSLRVDSTAEKSSFAGFDARLVRIHGDRFDVELWVSDEIAPPGPRRPTFEFLQALGGPLALPALLFDRLPGFPVRSIVSVTGGMFEARVMRALTKVTPIAAPASLALCG